MGRLEPGLYDLIAGVLWLPHMRSSLTASVPSVPYDKTDTSSYVPFDPPAEQELTFAQARARRAASSVHYGKDGRAIAMYIDNSAAMQAIQTDVIYSDGGTAAALADAHLPTLLVAAIMQDDMYMRYHDDDGLVVSRIDAWNKDIVAAVMSGPCAKADMSSEPADQVFQIGSRRNTMRQYRSSYLLQTSRRFNGMYHFAPTC